MIDLPTNAFTRWLTIKNKVYAIKKTLPVAKLSMTPIQRPEAMAASTALPPCFKTFAYLLVQCIGNKDKNTTHTFNASIRAFFCFNSNGTCFARNNVSMVSRRVYWLKISIHDVLIHAIIKDLSSLCWQRKEQCSLSPRTLEWLNQVLIKVSFDAYGVENVRCLLEWEGHWVKQLDSRPLWKEEETSTALTQVISRCAFIQNETRIIRAVNPNWLKWAAWLKESFIGLTTFLTTWQL